MVEGYYEQSSPIQARPLLETMPDFPATVEFLLSDAPFSSSSTHNEFIKGFISIGDLNSAISCFGRMLVQPETPVLNPNGSSVKLLLTRHYTQHRNHIKSPQRRPYESGLNAM